MSPSGLKKESSVFEALTVKPPLWRTSITISDCVAWMTSAMTMTVAMIMAKSTMAVPVRKRLLSG